MRLFAAVLAISFVTVVSGRQNCTSCSPECGPNEDPVKGRPRRDRFCRPWYTPYEVWKKLRMCLCKRGYVRNSWDECVPTKDCRRCRCRQQKEWHLCSSPCPVTCNKAIERCTKPCSPGCDCPPGWVLHPKDWRKCVKAAMCLPQCPPNSTFHPCFSSCEPKCGKKLRECVTQCHRGSCVCDKGFTGYDKDGKQSCLRNDQCSQHLNERPLFVLNETGASTPITSTTTVRPQSTLSLINAEARRPSSPTNAAATIITGSTGLSGINVATSAVGMHPHTAGAIILSGATVNTGSTSELHSRISDVMHPTAGSLSVTAETSANASGNTGGFEELPATAVSSGAVPPATALTVATSAATAATATSAAATDATAVSTARTSSPSTTVTSASIARNPTGCAISGGNARTGTAVQVTNIAAGGENTAVVGVRNRDGGSSNVAGHTRIASGVSSDGLFTSGITGHRGLGVSPGSTTSANSAASSGGNFAAS